MSMIMTVVGPIASDELGPTVTHEHLLADLRVQWREPANERATVRGLRDAPVTTELLPLLRRYPQSTTLDNLLLADEAAAIEEVEHFRRAGGSCIVDLTNYGLSRDPIALFRIARATGVNIVMGGGCYVENAHPEWVVDASVEDLSDLFISDFFDGVDGTGISTGIIGEVGMSGYPKGSARRPGDRVGDMTPEEEKVLRASARAAVATGQAVSVHVSMAGRGAPVAIDTMESEGLSPARQVMCHMDSVPDLDYHREIMSRGATVEFSSFGREYYEDRAGASLGHDAARIALIAQLVSEGHADRIVISQDVCMKMDLRAHGGNGYAHILTTVVPRLRRAGVPGEAIRQMLVDNPRRILTLELGDEDLDRLTARAPYPLHDPAEYPPDDLRSVARNIHWF
jgi:phosphotriesterase-related protein